MSRKPARKTAFLNYLPEVGSAVTRIDDSAAECERRIAALRAELRQVQASLRKLEAEAERRAAAEWTPEEIAAAKKAAAGA